MASAESNLDQGLQLAADMSGRQTGDGATSGDELMPPGGQASTAFVVMDEAELALMRATEGDKVVLHEGRYWRSTHRGFFEPIHILARLTAHEATWPTLLSWGYRAALTDEAGSAANGTMPVYCLENVDEFSERSLSRNRRSDLRKCAKYVELKVLREPSLLIEQGHEVFMSSVERLGYWKSLTKAEYRRRVERQFSHGRRQVIAGLVDGRLAGYLDAFAVDGILYPEEIYVATDALRTGIGTGLYVETISNALRSGKIREVCNGLHTPENPSLCRFKESLRFQVVHVPTRSVVAPPALALIRARRPANYYRLTGDMPASLRMAAKS